MTHRVPLLLLLAILTAGCIDARTSVNSLTASVADAASTKDVPAGDRAQPALLEFAEPDVLIVEAQTTTALPVSAFGLRWVASGAAGESIPVRDQPGLASARWPTAATVGSSRSLCLPSRPTSISGVRPPSSELLFALQPPASQRSARSRRICVASTSRANY